MAAFPMYFDCKPVGQFSRAVYRGRKNITFLDDFYYCMSQILCLSSVFLYLQFSELAHGKVLQIKGLNLFSKCLHWHRAPS